MKTLIEILDKQLSDVKIAQRFRFTKDGLIYIKDTEQGLNNQSSYCHTEKKIKTKGYGYEKERHTLRPQSSPVYEILPDIKKENRGGNREGSGRPSLFKEKTKGVKFMCPISKEGDLKKYVNRKLLEWSKSGI